MSESAVPPTLDVPVKDFVDVFNNPKQSRAVSKMAEWASQGVGRLTRYYIAASTADSRRQEGTRIRDGNRQEGKIYKVVTTVIRDRKVPFARTSGSERSTFVIRHL